MQSHELFSGGKEVRQAFSCAPEFVVRISLFVRQHAHCIQIRICMPEECKLDPISTFIILEVKLAKSLRISFIAAEFSSSSESTKSSLNAGTLTFSGLKKSRLFPFSVESRWTGLFSGALWISWNLEKLVASYKSRPLDSGVR